LKEGKTAPALQPTPQPPYKPPYNPHPLFPQGEQVFVATTTVLRYLQGVGQHEVLQDILKLRLFVLK
jgi:hypothetical protein